MIKICAFTSGQNDPSARLRVRQYIPKLEEENITISEFPAYFSSYPPASKVIRPLWAGAALALRGLELLRSYKYNATLIQKPFISTYSTLEQFTKAPKIFDVDDAIWAHQRGGFAARIAKKCQYIICGNEYIAGWFSAYNKNISIIPTPVDTQKYYSKNAADDLKKIIGWIGTSGNYPHLYQIEKALFKVIKKYPTARLQIVSNTPPGLKLIPPSKVDFSYWNEESEVKQIQNMTVGIMPLDDSDFSKGKCSYKMLTYMACGLPVVVSPVGMNKKVLECGDIGFGAKSESQWISALETLLSSNPLRQKYGMNGRQVVEKYFSLNIIAPEMAMSLRSMAR